MDSISRQFFVLLLWNAIKHGIHSHLSTFKQYVWWQRSSYSGIKTSNFREGSSITACPASMKGLLHLLPATWQSSFTSQQSFTISNWSTTCPLPGIRFSSPTPNDSQVIEYFTFQTNDNCSTFLSIWSSVLQLWIALIFDLSISSTGWLQSINWMDARTSPIFCFLRLSTDNFYLPWALQNPTTKLVVKILFSSKSNNSKYRVRSIRIRHSLLNDDIFYSIVCQVSHDSSKCIPRYHKLHHCFIINSLNFFFDLLSCYGTTQLQ